MPQASGVALGFDRLVMLASGALQGRSGGVDATGRRGMNRIDPKLAATLRQPAELVERGLAPAAELAELEQVAARYAVAVTPDIAALIDPEDPDDPIARQFIPSARGTGGAAGRERRSDRRSTRIRRSPASCIAIPTGCCSSWCTSARCIAGSVFAAKWSGRARRRALSEAAYRDALDYIRAHPEIWEVILTGGDPLMLSPRRLAEIMADLAAIDHVKIIRIHTRVPVAEPARIDGEMVAALRVEGATTWVAVHANHPRELTGRGPRRLRAAGRRRHSAGQPVGAAARRQ